MKKNLMMKVASLMLILALASTCMIGTTFAKYVTADRAEDTARVAKWGITVATSGTLFGTDYEKYSAADTADKITAATSTSVSAFNGTDSIVAPGTKNTVGFQVAISGDPEVQYDVIAAYTDINSDSVANADDIEDIYLTKATYGVMVPVYGVNNATDVTKYYILDDTDPADTFYTKATSYDSTETYYDLHDGIEVTEDKYFPITWTVVASGTAKKPADIATQKDLKLVAAAIINGLNADALNGVANAEIDAKYTLTWAWDFGGAAGTITDADKKDTILGNLAAGATNVVVLSGSNYYALTVANGQATSTKSGDTTVYANLEVAFGISVTVEQVN